ncbi:MAG: DNA polymerase III subunit delta, partial [Candidatus Acidiferrales bacterium]
MAARRPSRRPASPAYLIVGPDSYLRSQARERIIGAHVPAEVRDFAVGRFSLERTPLGTVLAQALNRPMLSPVQVLVITELEGVKEEALAELEEYFSTPADFTVLVFEAEELDRRTRLWHVLERHCEVVEAEPGDDRDA